MPNSLRELKGLHRWELFAIWSPVVWLPLSVYWMLMNRSILANDCAVRLSGLLDRLGTAQKLKNARRSPLGDDFVAEALHPVDLFLQLHGVGLVGVAIADR